MTGRELLAALQALPDDKLDLPIRCLEVTTRGILMMDLEKPVPGLVLKSTGKVSALVMCCKTTPAAMLA